MKYNGDKKEITWNITLSDLLDLSMIDIFILIYLLAFQIDDSVRYSVLQDLNTYLSSRNSSIPNNSQTVKQISPSSFYNSLKKLESKGLINHSKKTGRKQIIQSTPLTKPALLQLYFLIFMSLFDVETYTSTFINPIFEKIGSKSVESLLFISFDRVIFIPVVNLLNKLNFAKNIFILSDDETFEKQLAKISENIQQSTLLNNKIREVQDTFDITIILRYRTKGGFGGLQSENLLQEAVRVTKSDGYVVTAVWGEFPKTNNFILDSITKEIQAQMPFTSEEQLLEDLTKADLQQIQIMNVQGAWIALGRVK